MPAIFASQAHSVIAIELAAANERAGGEPFIVAHAPSIREGVVARHAAVGSSGSTGETRARRWMVYMFSVGGWRWCSLHL